MDLLAASSSEFLYDAGSGRTKSSAGNGGTPPLIAAAGFPRFDAAWNSRTLISET